MTLWQRLYLSAADPAHTNTNASLHAALLQQFPQQLDLLDFKAYDPFGLMPSTRAYAQVVKGFVAPPDDRTHWLQWIAAPDSALPEALLQALSQQGVLVLSVVLEDEATAVFTVYRDGERLPDWQEDLQPYSVNTTASSTPTAAKSSSSTSSIPTDGMPDDLRAMTDQLGGLQSKQVQKLMNRVTNKLLNSDQQQEGESLLRGAQVDWSHPGGQQITQVLTSLGIPDWRSPEYSALRDAYQLQRRLQRNPNARLYPGDQDAINAVPDALRYTPIFAGRVER
jgi:hypothetical protein